MREAYNLIWMKTEEEWKTAFRTRYDLYEYTVMSFELINASTSCQELLNNTLREYLNIFVIVYLNDILIFSQIIEEHEQHIKKVLECLSKRNLLIKSEKCDWHKKEVDFLRFIVEINDVRMNPDKLTSVKAWPVPTNVKEVQAFLGFVNYNIKDRPWKWEEDEQTAFERLRDACLSNSVLRMVDMSSSIRIETDAFNLAIGAYLNQQINGKWHPAAYFSRKLSPAEQNYDIHDKELLVIVAALKHWRVYAEGASSLDIYIDHKNLLQFIIIKELNRRQVRWAEELEQYKFKIHYISRKENGRADALNRRCDYMTIKEKFDHNVLKINDDEIISTNHYQINATLHIIKND